MARRKAQDAAFWTTTVMLSKSKAELEAVLEKFGAAEYGSYFINRHDEQILTVHFVYNERGYRFEYTPLPPDYNRGYRSKDDLDQQALRQMGRIAVNHCKVLLQLIDSGHEELLLPYLILPGDTTLQRIGPEEFMPMLQAANSGLLALTARSPEDAEFEEVDLG